MDSGDLLQSTVMVSGSAGLSEAVAFGVLSDSDSLAVVSEAVFSDAVFVV